MQDYHKAISMAGSKLGWEDVDHRAKSIGFRERSKYIQYLVERDIEHSRFENIRIMEVTSLLLMVMILLVLIIRI